MLAKTEEEYISFNAPVKVGTRVCDGKDVVRHLRFIDSFRFMRSGLSSLASNLEKNQLKILGGRYKGRKLELLSRKGVYPYDYVDSPEKLND